MVDFIRDNKEWLFSGVGVAIFLGLLSFAAKMINRSRRTKVCHSFSQKMPPKTIEKYSGSILVNTNSRDYRVFYPVTFDKIPNLRIYVKNEAKYAVTEERPDGFILRIEYFSPLSIRDWIRGGFLIKWQVWGRTAVRQIGTNYRIK